MISVVMPCHLMNETHLELTKSANASLGEVELIIVDDASPVGGGYLRSVADIYVRNKENLGYGRTVNRGLRLASNDYIAIANNDIRISPNWQGVVEEVFQSPQVYTCHFRMINYDEPFAYGDKLITRGKERWCHASFFVLNKKNNFLLYDEKFFNTYDDWDYFFRVRSLGLLQAYTDKACFQHVHSATIPALPKHTERNKENTEYFALKWGESAESLFAKQFPEQMKTDYWEGFKL